MNKYGETILHFAVNRRYLEVVQFLLKLEPSLATIGTDATGLPLHSAISEGKTDCVEALTTPENINSEGIQGRTPLIEAARNGQLSLVDVGSTSVATPNALHSK